MEPPSATSLLELPLGTDLAEALVRASPFLILWLREDLTIGGLNRPYPGIPRERIIGRSALDFIPDEYKPTALETYAKVRETGELGTYSLRIRGGDGRFAYYESHIAPLHRDGSFFGYVLYSQDVTRLRTDEAGLALAVKATGIGLWTHDLTTGHVEWNREMHAITGHTEPLTLERYLALLPETEDRQKILESAARSLETGVMEGIPHRFDRPDGTSRWLVALGSIEFDASRRPVFAQGATIDVTEQRKYEVAAQESARLEALGQLTAGIAHNFNNLLAIMLPALDRAATTEAPADPEEFRDARAAALRARELVRELLVFARNPTESDGTTVDLRALVEGVARSFRRRHPECAVHIGLPAEPALVAGSAAMLEQVLTNLANNAVDATNSMSDSRIDLTLSLTASDVILHVEDNGPGVPESVRSRIFEPFFTTKPVGAGTGLGLSTAYATIRGLGGTIECAAVPGSGTRFVVRLPRTHDARVTPISIAPPAATPLRVLVVDDDEPVRRAVVSMLKRGGLEPVAAAGGEEALELLRTMTFDVAILDRSMPGIDGIELARRIRGTHDHLPLLLFTGGRVTDEESVDFRAVLHKPARQSELVSTILSSVSRGAPVGC